MWDKIKGLPAYLWSNEQWKGALKALAVVTAAAVASYFGIGA